MDTMSFSSALRAALRQDPDVVLVGEMRDLETIETALLAAETGHLVLSTLHTLDSIETIDRIVAMFPPYHQTQVRLQLAMVLKSVISMRLVPMTDKKGRVPAAEIMITTPLLKIVLLILKKHSLLEKPYRKGHLNMVCKHLTNRFIIYGSKNSYLMKKP